MLKGAWYMKNFKRRPRARVLRRVCIARWLRRIASVIQPNGDLAARRWVLDGIQTPSSRTCFTFPMQANDVYVYSYPQGKLTGKLTGFHYPQGLCVDKAGDVFVTNSVDRGKSVFEYAHGKPRQSRASRD